MEVNFFVHTAGIDWNHLSDDQVKAPHTSTSNDWLPPQASSNSHAHSSLIASKSKVRFCEIWKQDLELQHDETPSII